MIVKSRFAPLSAFAAPLLLSALAACTTPGGGMAMGLRLTGDQAVPPVMTSAAATGMITVAADGMVSGSITTTGLAGTMAHVHMAPPGFNGPVIIPLTKTGDSVWSVPPGAKLTAEQFAAYRAGGLYVNVHSDANKGGEIRTQLMP
jgi:hypothetical protein